MLVYKKYVFIYWVISITLARCSNKYEDLKTLLEMNNLIFRPIYASHTILLYILYIIYIISLWCFNPYEFTNSKLASKHRLIGHKLQNINLVLTSNSALYAQKCCFNHFSPHVFHCTWLTTRRDAFNPDVAGSRPITVFVYVSIPSLAV